MSAPQQPSTNTNTVPEKEEPKTLEDLAKEVKN